MGLFKIIAITFIPAAAAFISSIRLGKLLPVASRQLGNVIGMGYVYFKVIIRNLKPKNEIGMQLLNIARKASQQTAALKRQIGGSVTRTKQQFSKRLKQELNQQSQPQQSKLKSIYQLNPQNLNPIANAYLQRFKVIQQKQQKKRKNKFFDDV